MAVIKITNLRLRTIIGINDWERENKQDVILNIELEYDASRAAKTDDVKDTVDYKDLTKKIIKRVEASRFFLIEKLADAVLQMAMENPLVHQAKVRVDKPFALRFADSVSVELNRGKDQKTS